MEEDLVKKRYFSDNERFADLINGYSFGGKQVVSATDLSERDSQTGLWLHFPRKRYGWKRIKYRDLIRKVAFGVNFAVVGIENQEEVHYLMPLRTMVYDAGEYENQAAKIKRKVKKIKGVSRAEFLSGFRKENKLKPCITIVLYYGNDWDGAMNLHSILDFTDIPEPLRNMVGNYHINLLDIRKLEDTSVFRTDLKQVFDFIRLSEDKAKLLELVENDSSYKQMDDDAYDVAISFTKSEKLIEKQKFAEGGKVNMCRALVELREEGIQLGIEQGIEQGRTIGRFEGENRKLTEMVCKKLQKGKSPEIIADELEEEIDQIQSICKVAFLYAPRYDCDKVYDAWKDLRRGAGQGIFWRN